MRYVALIQHGPAWVPGKQVWEQGRPVQQHLVAMRELYISGQLLLGGPYRHTPGGVAVLEADSHAAAVAIMDADPAVRAGVFSYELHALRAYFDAFEGQGTDLSVQELHDEAASSRVASVGSAA